MKLLIVLAGILILVYLFGGFKVPTSNSNASLGLQTIGNGDGAAKVVVA